MTPSPSLGAVCVGWSGEETLSLDALHADARKMRQAQFALNHFHASEAVVGDEQVAVEVGKVYGRRQL